MEQDLTLLAHPACSYSFIEQRPGQAQGRTVTLFTAEQLQAYARANVAADRARREPQQAPASRDDAHCTAPEPAEKDKGGFSRVVADDAGYVLWAKRDDGTFYAALDALQALQEQGGAARPVGTLITSNPLYQEEFAPGVTGEDMEDWLEKAQAWARGWTLEDTTRGTHN
jgi:hypothetical protein